MAGSEQRPGQGLPPQIGKALNYLRGKPTPSPEDEIWDEYMLKKRDWRGLIALVQDQELQPTFQQRAIEVLLSPDISALPFRVNVDKGTKTYASVGTDWVEGVTDAHASYIAEKIPTYVKQVSGTTRRDEYNYDAVNALFAYNFLIPKLLPRVPQEQAAKLFESFSINDPIAYADMDHASGYNPLSSLYSDPKIDEIWKRQAAIQMHQIIEKEQRGEALPRESHEAAANCYSEALGSMLFDDQLPVSEAFYRDEIKFMLGIAADRIIVAQWHTGRALDLLDDPELRHGFARHQVLTGEPDSFDRFKVNDSARAETARRIIVEFPNDFDMKAYLQEQLDKWQIRASQYAKEEEQATKTEQDILSRMKKPSAAVS